MSPTIAAQWSELGVAQLAHEIPELAAVLKRSSHCLNIVGDKAYIFFGEQSPRVPLAPDVIEVRLQGVKTLQSISPTSLWPAPRVGAASVVIGSDIYVWGGRGGEAMDPLSNGEEGPWKFDTNSKAWSKLEGKGSIPEGRSYHTLTSNGKDTLYLHAGCPVQGRLGTLHAFHIPSSTWTSLPPAPGPGRGGTVLASLPSLSTSTTGIATFIRYGGFAGHELGHDNEGGLDIFFADKNEWVSAGNEGEISVRGDHPPRRSVHGLVGVDEKLKDSDEIIRALLFSGESGPAPPELGHAGAGLFHSDVYALISQPATPFTFRWQVVPVHSSSSTPEPRGWLAATPLYDTHEKSWKAFMVGGLTKENNRLGDAWTLKIIQNE